LGIKSAHTHEHTICGEKSEKYFFSEHESCMICDYHISTFILKTELKTENKNKLIDCYCNNYKTVNIKKQDYSTVLLRAPPQKEF
jgi:hypothetical protein